MSINADVSCIYRKARQIAHVVLIFFVSIGANCTNAELLQSSVTVTRISENRDRTGLLLRTESALCGEGYLVKRKNPMYGYVAHFADFGKEVEKFAMLSKARNDKNVCELAAISIDFSDKNREKRKIVELVRLEVNLKDHRLYIETSDRESDCRGMYWTGLQAMKFDEYFSKALGLILSYSKEIDLAGNLDVSLKQEGKLYCELRDMSIPER